MTPTLKHNNVIYQFKCSCNSLYVGKTSRRLEDRINQHVPPSFLQASVSTDKPRRSDRLAKLKVVNYCENDTSSLVNSAIRRHLSDNPACARSFSKDHFTILARCRSDFHRHIMEAIFITVLQPDLCIQKKFVNSLLLFK